METLLDYVKKIGFRKFINPESNNDLFIYFSLDINEKKYILVFDNIHLFDIYVTLSNGFEIKYIQMFEIETKEQLKFVSSLNSDLSGIFL